MAELARGFLGLTHNPFAGAGARARGGDGFFAGSDRKTYLEQLRHLKQWPARISVVTGSLGVGKTKLFGQLSTTLDPGVKGARISGTLVSFGREVLAGVANGLGLDISRDANSEELATLVREHVGDQAAIGRACVTLVDDAHLLDFVAIDELLRLARRCPLHVVFFGEPTVASVVAASAAEHDVDWHEIRLGAFSASDTRRYLEWRFGQAKYRGHLPFTDVQVEALTDRSGGVPGRIDEAADDLLTRLGMGEVAPKPAFPSVHGALAGLLAVVVGLLYVLTQSSVQPPTTEAPFVLAKPVPAPATHQRSAAGGRGAPTVQPVVATVGGSTSGRRRTRCRDRAGGGGGNPGQGCGHIARCRAGSTGYRTRRPVAARTASGPLHVAARHVLQPRPRTRVRRPPARAGGVRSLPPPPRWSHLPRRRLRRVRLGNRCPPRRNRTA